MIRYQQILALAGNTSVNLLEKGAREVPAAPRSSIRQVAGQIAQPARNGRSGTTSRTAVR
jgi:hypothetical protein